MNVTMLDRTQARRLATVAAVSLAAAATLAAAPARADDTGGSVSVGSGSMGSSSASASAGGTDHAGVVGHLAFGWMGVNGVTIGNGDYAGACNNANQPPCRPGANISARQISAPTIGVRYWLNDRIGIDVGLGIGIQSGSKTYFPYASELTNGNFDIIKKENKDSLFGVVIHAGVPIVLGEPGKHYTFTVIPEANVGFGSGSRKFQPDPARNGQPPSNVAPPDDIKFGGFRLDLGARVGSEIHFGFMGLPQLALQGSVGLFFSTQSYSVSIGGKDVSNSDTTIATSVQNAPWSIFTSNVAALYYF